MLAPLSQLSASWGIFKCFLSQRVYNNCALYPIPIPAPIPLPLQHSSFNAALTHYYSPSWVIVLHKATKFIKRKIKSIKLHALKSNAACQQWQQLLLLQWVIERRVRREAGEERPQPQTVEERKKPYRTVSATRRLLLSLYLFQALYLSLARLQCILNSSYRQAAVARAAISDDWGRACAGCCPPFPAAVQKFVAGDVQDKDRDIWPLDRQQDFRHPCSAAAFP